MSFFNPFRNIIETKTFPHARTLRTSFKEKISDAFFTFAGSFLKPRYQTFGGMPDLESKHAINHLGLIDYATLFIPYISMLLFFEGIKSENNFLKCLTYATSVITVPLIIARYGIAAILTLLSLPIIAIVHAFSLIKGSRLKEKLLQSNANYNNQADSFNPVTLDEKLNELGMDFDFFSPDLGLALSFC